tara:strand:- start:128 stop:376 length:249 start_codon:yes stop_codon:yes gene_type:complete
MTCEIGKVSSDLASLVNRLDKHADDIRQAAYWLDMHRAGGVPARQVDGLKGSVIVAEPVSSADCLAKFIECFDQIAAENTGD